MLIEPDKITGSSHLGLFFNIVVAVALWVRYPLYNFTFNILVDLELWMTLTMDFDLLLFIFCSSCERFVLLCFANRITYFPEPKLSFSNSFIILKAEWKVRFPKKVTSRKANCTLCFCSLGILFIFVLLMLLVCDNIELNPGRKNGIPDTIAYLSLEFKQHSCSEFLKSKSSRGL